MNCDGQGYSLRLDEGLMEPLAAVRRWHATEREKARLEEERQANVLAREQMERRVQGEVDRRAALAEAEARERAEAAAANELEMRSDLIRF